MGVQTLIGIKDGMKGLQVLARPEGQHDMILLEQCQFDFWLGRRGRIASAMLNVLPRPQGTGAVAVERRRKQDPRLGHGQAAGLSNPRFQMQSRSMFLLLF